MTGARKYAFDTEFAADGTILRDPTTGERKRLTVEEAEAEKTRAYQSGAKDAVAQAERAGADAAAHLARAARDVLTRLDALERKMRADAVHVGLAAARKLADAALAEFGEARIAAALEAAMEALPAGPRLVIRVAPAHMDSVRKRLDAAVADHAYAGAVLLKAEEAIALGDVRIEWAEGAIDLNRAEIEARVTALIDAALEAQAETTHAGDVA
ncbi:MAG: FliH/SctL family protein [Hyphomonadaceae bacterium]